MQNHADFGPRCLENRQRYPIASSALRTWISGGQMIGGRAWMGGAGREAQLRRSGAPYLRNYVATPNRTYLMQGYSTNGGPRAD